MSRSRIIGHYRVSLTSHGIEKEYRIWDMVNYRYAYIGPSKSKARESMKEGNYV